MTESVVVGQPSLQHYECEEYGTVPIALSELLDENGDLDMHDEVQNGYFQAYFQRKTVHLRAEGYVGYVPINDRVVVYIRPRVPLANLTRLAHISNVQLRVLSTARGYESFDSWSDSLADLYARELCTQARTLVGNGLLKEYQRREQTTSFPFGRLDVGRTVQRQLGRNVRHRAETTYFQRSADNAVNRCIKYALWSLAQHYIGTKPSTKEAKAEKRSRLQDLNNLYPAFDSVELDHSLAFLDDPVVQGSRELPSLRAYYRPSVDVAAMVARRQGLNLETATSANIRLPSLTVHMPTVFEEFLRNVLSQHAVANGWDADVVGGDDDPGTIPLYDTRSDPVANPDIIVRPHDQSARPLVMDVKYVPAKDLPKRESVEQVVTYAAAYGTGRVVLIHPCMEGQASGLTNLGRIGPVEVKVYRFNLGAEDLESEIAAFCTSVETLLPVPGLSPRIDIGWSDLRADFGGERL